jgi:hypothetical protein
MIARIKHQKSRKRKYYRLLNFHIEPELDIRISHAASLAGITMSDFIRNACLRAIAAAETSDDLASIENNPAE